MSAWLALVGLAAAWEPTSVHEIPAPEGITSIAFRDTYWVSTDEGTKKLTPEGWQQVDELGGELIAADLDGRGAPELIRCGPHGIDLIAHAGPPVLLDEAPCVLIAVLGAGPQAKLVSAGEAGLRTLQPEEGAVGITVVAEPGSAITALAADHSIAWVADGAPYTLVSGEPAPLEVEGSVVQLASTGLEWVSLSAPTPEAAANRWTIGDAASSYLEPLTSTGVILDDGLKRPFLASATRLLAPKEMALPFRAERIVAKSDQRCSPLMVLGEDKLAIIEVNCELSPKEINQLPSPPLTLELPPNERVRLHVYPGQRVQLELQDPLRGARDFALGGAPPGARVSAGGIFEYTPTEAHIGRWLATVKLRDPGSRRAEFVIAVHPVPLGWTPSPRDTAPKKPAPLARVKLLTYSPEEPPSRLEGERASQLFQLRSCRAGMGLAGGVARGAGVNWETLGRPKVLPLVGASYVFQCEVGPAPGIGLVAGFDGAPGFVWPQEDGAKSHSFFLTAGVEAGPPSFRAGPFVGGGVAAAALGARAAWLPWRGRQGNRHGFENRVAWLAPYSALEVLTAYTFGF